MDQSAAFGAAGTIVLGGSTYELRKFKLNDIAATQAWAKEQLRNPMEIAKEALEILQPTIEEPVEPKPKKSVGSMNAAEKEAWFTTVAEYKGAVKAWAREQAEYAQRRNLLLLDAKDDMENPKAGDKKAIGSIMRSLDGISYIIWRSIGHKNSGLTYEQVKEYLEDMEESEVMDKVKGIERIDPSLIEEMEAKKLQSAQGQTGNQGA